MDPSPIKAAIRGLQHQSIAVCVAGELALTYYNVPRVCHDIEIYVPKTSVSEAARVLCSTGQFEPCELESFNNYTEYKRGLPRLRTTQGSPVQHVLILPASQLGLDPISKNLVEQPVGRDAFLSRHILDMLPAHAVPDIPLPRLAALLKGLARRYLDTEDDAAMIATEQLVDGMDLDQSWCSKNLDKTDREALGLITSLVDGKKSRMDDFNGNLITCFFTEIDFMIAASQRLNDAAIALHRVLSREGINFGIFGGFAVGVMGGVRESKDIDCLASSSKEQILHVLDKKEGFEAIPQTRQDYVAFLWSERPDRANAVLVEIFCEQFPGSQFSMHGITSTAWNIKGLVLGEGTSLFLDPFYLFKGKLRAAATRAKFHDSADLRTLAGAYEAIIKHRAQELNLEYVGLAIKRYLILERLFEKLGVDVKAAKLAAKNLDPNKLPAPAIGDVQKGLLL
ncbi:hypothetical protein GQ53DRAFT_732457 [Thozetella sp. PMI_491]|nr:hypothetical protein GQ53DRAFT_732457 [Thozetella sp. PMI_491]